MIYGDWMTKIQLFIVSLIALAGLSNMVIGSSAAFASSLPEGGLASMPQGFIGSANVSVIGETLAPVIEQSLQFKELSGGEAYHVDPTRSFGYTWGVGIPSTERIILYSADNLSYIVAEVYVSNYTIQDIYFVDGTKIQERFQTASANYGGYYAEYCSSSLLGICLGESALSEVYGNIQIPSTISRPSSGCKGVACAAFGEWTGVSINSGGTNLTQGGISWAGFNVTPPSNNNNGFSLFVERLPGAATFFTPPSGWTVQGNTINMTSEPFANCANGGDLWYEVWKLGTSSTTQSIGCDSPSGNYYGWYIFEAPAGCSGTGCYSGYYQIPQVSSMGFTGNICNSATCRNINSNSDPIQGYYIQHNSQDTSTGTIASGGNSWTESWLSSS